MCLRKIVICNNSKLMHQVLFQCKLMNSTRVFMTETKIQKQMEIQFIYQNSHPAKARIFLEANNSINIIFVKFNKNTSQPLNCFL